jgi:OPT family oligopeptide transporter
MRNDIANCSPNIYNNKIGEFNVTEIITKDTLLDVEKYKKYSPLFQGPRIALAYALSFAAISCVLVHTALYEGKDLIRRIRFKRRDMEEDDVHMRAMRNYSEVPEWWFQVLLAVTFTASMVSVVAWPTFLPWWGFIVTLLLPLLFTLPIGIVQARSSQQIGLNVITEFVAGYLWPGRPVANILVKIYGYMTMSKGLDFVADLKMGMYMRIPPRAMFRFQIIGSFASNFTALGILHIYTTHENSYHHFHY